MTNRHPVSLPQTVNQNLEQAKKEWEATFDAFSDPIFIVDTEGNVIRCNHAVVDRMNTSYMKVIGRKLTEIISEGQTEKKHEADQSDKQARLLKNEWLCVHLVQPENRLYTILYYLFHSYNPKEN